MGKNLSGTGKNLSEIGLREIDPDIFVIWAVRKSGRRKGRGERVGEKISKNQTCDDTAVSALMFHKRNQS